MRQRLTWSFHLLALAGHSTMTAATAAAESVAFHLALEGNDAWTGTAATHTAGDYRLADDSPA